MAQAYTQPRRQALTAASPQSRASTFFVIGLVLMCLWPRFFYFGVLGRGVNLYSIISYLMALDVFRRLATSSNLFRRFATTVRTNFTPFLLFLLYHLFRLYSDVQGESVLHSLAVSTVQTFSDSIWLIIPIVYLNSSEKIAQAYRVMVLCGVMFFIFAGIEFYAHMPLLRVFYLNNLAVGDANILAAIDRASSYSGEFRIKGIFPHPIILGQIGGAFAPLAFHAWRHGSPIQKYAGLIILLGELALPTLTGARTGLVSPIIAMTVYFVAFTLQINNRRRFIALVAAVLFMAAASPVIIDAATTVIVGQDRLKQGSTNIREIQLAYGESAIKRRPLFGYGSDTSLKYAGVEAYGNVRTIDNYYLSEAIDHGLVGASLFAGLMLSLFYLCFSMAVREQNDTMRSLFSAIAALVAAPAVGLGVATISTGLSFIFFAAGTVITWRGVLAQRALILRGQGQQQRASAAMNARRATP